jgi:hypothetical protein
MLYLKLASACSVILANFKLVSGGLENYNQTRNRNSKNIEKGGLPPQAHCVWIIAPCNPAASSQYVGQTASRSSSLVLPFAAADDECDLEADENTTLI